VYDLGDQIPLSVTVRDAAGTLVNPATVTLTITLPDETSTAPAVPLPPVTTGKPLYAHVGGAVGRHRWRMETTGPAGAHGGVFTVRSGAPRWIISLEEARAQLNMAGTDADAELEEYLQATTDIVESITGPIVNLSVTEEIHDGGAAIVLNRTPVVSVVSIENLADPGITYGASDYHVSKSSGVIRHLGGAGFVGPVKVAYTAGRSNQTPEGAITAAKVIVQHLWRSQQIRPTGPPSPVATDNTPTVPLLGFAVPNAAVQMLTPHSRRRTWLAG
jgi:hypothetical protein